MNNWHVRCMRATAVLAVACRAQGYLQNFILAAIDDEACGGYDDDWYRLRHLEFLSCRFAGRKTCDYSVQ